MIVIGLLIGHLVFDTLERETVRCWGVQHDFAGASARLRRHADAPGAIHSCKLVIRVAE